MPNLKRLLVVDDEADAVEFVKAALERDDWQIEVARDGVEGLEAATANPPDLVILDVQMPRKSGFEVFTELRQNPSTRNIPVIMLTAVGERTGLHFTAADMQEWMGAEPCAFIEKPIDPESLLRNVERALQ